MHLTIQRWKVRYSRVIFQHCVGIPPLDALDTKEGKVELKATSIISGSFHVLSSSVVF